MDAIEFRSRLFEVGQLTNLCIEEGARPILENSGLTMLQARLLREIDRHERMTVGKLAQRLDLAKGNTSSMCKKLERQGLIERIRDTADERYVILVLTAEGKSRLEGIETKLEEKYTPIFKQMSEEERECVLKSIEILINILKQVQEG